MPRPVLLIEDDADIRLLAEMTLRMSGVEVVSCDSGRQGLKELESREFSLVILDVMMPDMSGYDVLGRIHEKMGSAAPPIALFTARPQDATLRDVKERPVAHILPKPFDPETFAKTVQELIGAKSVGFDRE
ncbi:response regulator [bacterium]|nr:response regulator [bacterium]MBU1984565.1 response regulator [bacterium]